MRDEQTDVDTCREIGKYAIRTCESGQPVDAALNCFIAGISLLAFAQSMNPGADGEKLIDAVLTDLRSSFLDMINEDKVN